MDTNKFELIFDEVEDGESVQKMYENVGNCCILFFVIKKTKKIIKVEGIEDMDDEDEIKSEDE